MSDLCSVVISPHMGLVFNGTSAVCRSTSEEFKVPDGMVGFSKCSSCHGLQRIAGVHFKSETIPFS